jgi:flavorubredoxin
MIQLKKGIYWVGAIDWNVRNFHGYVTNRGSTYNAYLIVDEKIALIDTVKKPFFAEMMSRIREIMEPSDIDYLISNHTEPDHSGSIKKFLQTATDTTLIATPAGKRGLQRYYGTDLTCTTTKDKPKVNLGARTLHFVPVPMVHWPDSMVTYIPEEKLLFSNDAFGQHLASSKRFDDEVDQSVLMYEAKTYYANIVMHLWGPIQRAFNTLKTIEVEMIAPSHGVVWRKRPESILEAYKGWVDGLSEPRVVIVYDTMWGSTEMIANALMEGISQVGVDVQLYSLSATNSTEIIANILDARTVLIGSPTLNNGLFPTVSKFLTYMKGLKPRNKLGAAFGSFGWGGGAKREAEALLKSTGIEVVENDLDVNYRPNSEELERAKEFGKYIATKTLNE